MKKSLTFIIGIAVFLVLLAYMFTYTVRYDEVAVLTTFDSATEDSLQRDAGLYWKLPWPIQRVYKYNNRIQLLEDRPQEIQLADGSTVIIKMHLFWRVDDPYSFFVSLQNNANAESALRTLLRDLTSVASEYRFDQFVNPDPSRLAIPEIERVARDRLQQQLATIRPGYGIAVEQVGVTRVILPEASTEKVFERMRKTRERLAEAARAEGKSQAAAITARAESAQKRILAFAERRAQAIRDEGNQEAAEYFTAFAEDQEFAVFLRQMEMLRETLRHNTTFILDSKSLWFLQPLRQDTPVAGPGAPVETTAGN
jgi:membrane protease subunit HflC